MIMLIKRILIRIKSDSFAKGFSFLLSGTMITQLITLVMAPILTRLYSPSEYGINAVYMSLLTIFVVISTLRLQIPIAMSDDENEKKALNRLSLLSSIMFSLVTLIIVILYSEEIIKIFGLDSTTWLWMLPISIFLFSLYEIMFQNLLSASKYKSMANVTIVKVVTQGIFQILLSITIDSYMGLILGNLFSYIISIILISHFILPIRNNNKLPLKYHWKILRKNIDFPKYACPAELTSIASYSVIPIFITYIFSSEVTGYYSLANRLIGIPIGLFGNSLRQVFIREASNELSQTNSVAKSFVRTSKILVFIAIPTSLIIFIVSPTFFKLVFGEEWISSGHIVQAIILLFLARFIVVPITSTANVIGRQKVGLYFHAFLLTSIILISFVSKIIELNNPIDYLLILSIVYSSIYFAFYYFLYNMVKKG
ncbi:lipopolysaccharide biosynthesis protein [Guptibacillus hwajinpoensis]|uniref:lipopolysaccharide biosynthesis protein n=1 Tax=Guptibacillus hwajinpoensis TaxID=208199 RepID=UPI003736F3B4